MAFVCVIIVVVVVILDILNEIDIKQINIECPHNLHSHADTPTHGYMEHNFSLCLKVKYRIMSCVCVQLHYAIIRAIKYKWTFYIISNYSFISYIY